MTDNPYNSPTSDLHTSAEPTPKRSMGWKIYFFIITLVAILGSISFLTAPNAGIAELLSIVFTVIATAGLFGFVFLKRVYKASFWRGFLFVYLAFSVLYYFITNIDLKVGMTDLEFYVSTVIGILVSLPAYFALYQYGNPNKAPWTATDAPNQ